MREQVKLLREAARVREYDATQGAGLNMGLITQMSNQAEQQRQGKLTDEQKKAAAEAEKRRRRQAQSAADLATQLQRQIALTNEVDDAKDRILQRDYEIADLAKQFPELKQTEIEKLEILIEKLHEAREAEIQRDEAAQAAADAAEKARKDAEDAEEARRKALEADPGYQMKQQLEELVKLENQVAAGAIAIGNAFGNSFKSVITGSKSAEQALADMMASVAEHFLDMAAQIIAQQIAMILYGTIMKALGVGLPGVGGGGGASSIPGSAYGDMSVAGPDFFSGGMIPGYAQGGFVDEPTRALIGEGGESEYVIPASKMNEAMGRYARGARGGAVIPDGSGGDDGNQMANAGGSIDVSYSVERINNVDYVTAAEFEKGMAKAVKQGAEMGRRNVYSDLVNKRSVRSRVGV